MANYKTGDKVMMSDGVVRVICGVDPESFEMTYCVKNVPQMACGGTRPGFAWFRKDGTHRDGTPAIPHILYKVEPEPASAEVATDEVMSKILGGFDDPGSFITTVDNHELAKDIVAKGVIRNCGPSGGPAGDLKPKFAMGFDSPKYDFDGMLVYSSVVDGNVLLNFSSDAAQLAESDVPMLLRTIETVMEQARRAKEVWGE